MEEHLHMSDLTGKSLKGLQSFFPMLHAEKNAVLKAALTIFVS